MTNPDLLKTLEKDLGSMSRAFRQIARFVIAEPDQFNALPIRGLSEKIGVSEPSLIRFSRHYGFKGVPEFRLALAKSIAARTAGFDHTVEPDIHAKAETNREAKRRIAEAAGRLVASDTSILLDSGSTVQMFSKTLGDARPMTILTTGLLTFLDLRDADQHTLMLPGGILRSDAMSLTGRMVENTLSTMTFDTAYIGADSIDPDFGLSTFSEEEAHLTRAMIRAAKRVVVLADASKFTSPSLHKICDVADVDIFVTETGVSEDIQTALQNQGAELMLVPASAP